MPADLPGASASRRVRSVIERLVASGTNTARTDGSRHELFPVAVNAAEGEALRSWVVREGATQTIEIGLGYGISALFVCEGLLENGSPRARHVVMDPHQSTRFGGCGIQALEDAGVIDLVEVHESESQIVLPRLLTAGRTFDVAFVDGNHRFDGVFVDLVYLARLVRPGGVVIVDDYQLESIRRAVAFFVANRGWTPEEVSTADDDHHWAVVRTSAEPDTRPFHHFVDF